MKVQVINAGSSSIKFTTFNIEKYQVLANGIVERIGLTGTRLRYHKSGAEAPVEKEVQVEDTRTAVGLITEHLTDGGIGVIEGVDEIGAVGHRVVHADGKACEIQSSDSRIRVLLVPTNEELEIARQTWQMLPN